MVKLCVSTGIATFLIVLYCCIGIEFLPDVVTNELLDNPLFKFGILALMALVFCYDHYIAILIGFGYILTKLKVSSKYACDKKIILKTEHISTEEPSSKSNTIVDSDVKPENKNIPLIDLVENNFNENSSISSDFTSSMQFKSAQSNIVSDSALETEVRTWDSGYGTQGGFST